MLGTSHVIGRPYSITTTCKRTDTPNPGMGFTTGCRPPFRAKSTKGLATRPRVVGVNAVHLKHNTKEWRAADDSCHTHTGAIVSLWGSRLEDDDHYSRTTATAYHVMT